MNRAARQNGRTAARAPGSLVLSRPLLSALVIGGVVFLLAVAGQPAAAQSITDHVASITDGQVRFSFAAREGVCGDGDRISTHRETEDWEGPCDAGPARVAIDIEHGKVLDIDTYVGGRWRPRAGALDLGLVSVVEATESLLSLAETASDDVAERAIFPATLADSVEVWPRLLRFAKSETHPRDVRKAAVFWLSVIAADVAVDELSDLVNDADEDLEIRKMALFGLSQLSDHQGVPALLDIARTHENREMRKQAIFWLGQTDDPRAIALFEEILTSRR